MKTKRIWILDEGSQGHLVQSRGLIRELSKIVRLEVAEIPIDCALPKRISRSLIKRILRLVRCMWMFRILYPQIKLPESPPDLVVSSGPHSLAALEFLSKHLKCPSVFIQGTLQVPEGAVTAIMRPFEGKYRDDFIFIPLLFTEITPQLVEITKSSFKLNRTALPKGPLNTLFIGNSSAKIRFTQEDWDGVIRLVNGLWKKDGSQWLITTSHRTGCKLEDYFKRGIDPAAIFEAVWYSESPRKVTKEYLGMADRVFVTMDSLTMLTEAVASGRSTCALCPAGQHADLSNTHLRYVHDMATKGLITQLDLRHVAIPPSMPPPTKQIDYSLPIHQLLTRIHWDP